MDLSFIGVSAGVFLLLLLLVGASLRLCGVPPKGILSTDEWRVLGKLFVVLGLTLILFQRLVSADLPSELFIYGRF